MFEMKPVRIQRKRTPGFNLQAASPNGLPVVSVTRPGKWGNKFKITHQGDRYHVDGSADTYATKEEAVRKSVALHKVWLLGQIRAGKLDLSELRNKNVACFCKLGDPCHGDNLLFWANE